MVVPEANQHRREEQHQKRRGDGQGPAMGGAPQHFSGQHGIASCNLMQMQARPQGLRRTRYRIPQVTAAWDIMRLSTLSFHPTSAPDPHFAPGDDNRTCRN